VFKPTDQFEDYCHFSLVHWMVVSPADLYRRNCECGDLDDALVLLQLEGVDGLDPDLYHMESIRQNERSVRVIDAHLKKIQNMEWVYDYCINTADSSDQFNQALLRLALAKWPDDHRLDILSTGRLIRVSTGRCSHSRPTKTGFDGGRSKLTD
jgi:hypothetical protein